MAADRLLEGRTFSGHWSHTIKPGIGQSTVEVDFSGTLGEIEIEIEIELALIEGADAQLRGTASVRVDLRVNAKNIGSCSAAVSSAPNPTVTFEPR